jgi:hypothetical protein
MSTFPILYLYNPKDKRDKEVIYFDLCSNFRERIPQAINSFFLKDKYDRYMWIATLEREDTYSWNLHYNRGTSYKKLEVIKIK